MELQVFSNAEFGSVRSIMVNDEPFLLCYKVLPQIFCNTFCNMVLSATFSNGLHRVFAR